MQAKGSEDGRHHGPTGLGERDRAGAVGRGCVAGPNEAHCAFSTDDIEADHATLHEPAQFFFRDVDGNRFLIVEPG